MARKSKKQEDSPTIDENGTEPSATTLEAVAPEMGIDGRVSAAPPVETKEKKDKKKKKKKGEETADLPIPRYTKSGRLNKEFYEAEELRLQEELVKLRASRSSSSSRAATRPGRAA